MMSDVALCLLMHVLPQILSVPILLFLCLTTQERCYCRLKNSLNGKFTVIGMILLLLSEQRKMVFYD